MARMRGLLGRTLLELTKVERNAEKLQDYVENNPTETGELERLLLLLMEQKEQLQHLVAKQAAALPDSGNEESKTTIEETIYSYKISRTHIHVLQRTEEAMKMKLSFKNQSSVVEMAVSKSKGLHITDNHTLPVFIPFYINRFTFDNFENMVIAAAQVYEAFYRRCESVQSVEDQYRELLVHRRVEKDFSCTRLEMTLRYDQEEEVDVFLIFQFRYSLGDIKAKRVDVEITGAMDERSFKETRKQCKLFMHYPFFTAFEKFMRISREP